MKISIIFLVSIIVILYLAQATRSPADFVGEIYFPIEAQCENDVKEFLGNILPSENVEHSIISLSTSRGPYSKLDKIGVLRSTSKENEHLQRYMNGSFINCRTNGETRFEVRSESEAIEFFSYLETIERINFNSPLYLELDDREIVIHDRYVPEN